MADKISKTRKYNMLNPEDCKSVLQFILDDASDDDEEFNDDRSIGSDEEFSGDDVGDGSDEEIEEEVQIHCVDDNVQYDSDEETKSEEKNQDTLKRSKISRKKLISPSPPIEKDHDSEFTKELDGSENRKEVNFHDEIDKMKESYGTPVKEKVIDVSTEDTQTPVRATGIDRMSLFSSTPVKPTIDTTEVGSQVGDGLKTSFQKPIHAKGLVLADLAFARDQLKLHSNTPVSSLMVFDFYGIKFNDSEERKKASKRLRYHVERVKEMKKHKPKELESESARNNFVFLFEDYLIKPANTLCSTAERKLFCSPSSLPLSKTPQRSEGTETRGCKPKNWKDLGKCGVRKRKQNFAEEKVNEIREFTSSSANRLTNLDLLKEIGKRLFGD